MRVLYRDDRGRAAPRESLALYLYRAVLDLHVPGEVLPCQEREPVLEGAAEYEERAVPEVVLPAGLGVGDYLEVVVARQGVRGGRPCRGAPPPALPGPLRRRPP